MDMVQAPLPTAISEEQSAVAISIRFRKEHKPSVTQMHRVHRHAKALLVGTTRKRLRACHKPVAIGEWLITTELRCQPRQGVNFSRMAIFRDTASLKNH
jgi:hypothetical protein